MSTVFEIESAIEKLPSSECNELLAWFRKYLAASATSVDSRSRTKKEESLFCDRTVVNVASESIRKKLSGFEILGDLIGSVKDAPRDLSSNSKYLAGYGRDS